MWLTNNNALPQITRWSTSEVIMMMVLEYVIIIAVIQPIVSNSLQISMQLFTVVDLWFSIIDNDVWR